MKRPLKKRLASDSRSEPCRPQRHYWKLILLMGLGLAGCAHNRNLPATSPSNQPPAGDPFFNSTPASRTNPAATPTSQDPLKNSGRTTSTPTTSQSQQGRTEQTSATLMAPMTLGPGAADLATTNNQGTTGRSDPSWSPLVQQIQWQNQNTAGTLEHSLMKLRQLGAVEQRLIFREGRWLFSCEFVHPQNPQQRRHFEHEDTSELAVVRAVLDQVEQQKGW